MADEKRLIEIPCDGIVRIPIMSGQDTVGEKIIDLSHFPTVDAVEVVRCKACKEWCRNSGITESPNGHCFCHDIETNGHDFCSYGERRGNV